LVRASRLVAGYLPAADMPPVSEWIQRNEVVLIEYWEFTIDTDELLQLLQRLP